MLEYDWFLTAHIYSLILLCNSKTVRLLEACNQTVKEKNENQVANATTRHCHYMAHDNQSKSMKKL